MPNFLKTRCCKLDAMVGEINKYYREYITAKRMSTKMSQVRDIMNDHLGGMSELLNDMSLEVSEIKTNDFQTAYRVRRYFERIAHPANSVECIVDVYGRATVNCMFDTFERTDSSNISAELSNACEKNFDSPYIRGQGKEICVSFSEKTCYTVSVETYQVPHSGYKYCGDAYEHYIDDKGCAHVILSDGMGSGGRAAIDGAMASSLLSKLVRSGFSFDAAIKIVNSSLLIKSGDESVATLDCICIDLFTGKSQIYKAGAAPTFLKRGDSVMKIETGSLPIGIITGVGFEKISLSLQPNDVIVMVSDGAVEEGSSWLEMELKSINTTSSKDIIKKLTSVISQKNNNQPNDDVTVIAMTMSRIK